MKKVIALVAILGFAGSIASAQVGNFKYEGDFKFHKYYNSNTTDANSDAGDKKEDQDYQANIGISFDAGQDANVQINLIKNAGANDVNFGQAYVGINSVLKLDHKFGRMFYGKAGDIVAYYGPDAWYVSDMPYTALEGWLGEWKNEKLNVNAVIGKEVDAKTAKATDVNIHGLTASYQLHELLNPTAYIYKQVTISAAGTADDTLNVYGVKGNGKFMGFDYYGEYAMSRGAKSDTVDYEGSALLLGASYNLDLLGKWTFSGEYGMGSGDEASAGKDEDFTAIASNYRPGIIWGAGTNSLSDLTTWNVGAMWNLEKYNKLTLSGKLLNFSPTEEPATYDTYGTELDLCAKWQHTENVSFKGYYAMFMADKDYMDIVNDATNDDDGTDDAAYQFGVLVNVKF